MLDFPKKTWEFIRKESPVDVFWPAKDPKDATHLEIMPTVLGKYGFSWVRLHEQDRAPEASLGAYYANTEIKRAESLQKILEDETCQVLWAGAGGFGSLSVLDYLENKGFNLEGLKIRPIVGFSNITAFHLWAAKYRWPSLHACNASANQEIPITGQNETSILPLLQVLTGEMQELTYEFEVLNPEVISNTSVQGSVVGGNLSVVQRSQGSPTALNGKDRFIFLEDTPEYFNRTEELLCSLARAGTFDQARALIFGSLPIVQGKNINLPKTQDLLRYFEEKFLRIRRTLTLPLLYSEQFGHGAINHVLPFGTQARLTFPEKTTAILSVHVNASAYEI